MNLFIFEIIYFLFFLSSVGYGILFNKLFKILPNSSNFGFLSLYGLIFLVFISYISIFFISHNIYFNLILHFIGIFIFFEKLIKKKIRIEKIYFLIIFILSLSLLISKNHDDFPYYHLQQSLNFTFNSIQIGLSNLDLTYAHQSSLLLLNSLYYIPKFKYFFFNVPNLIFYTSVVLIFYNFSFSRSRFNFHKFFSLLSLIYILVKFTRLSEFGTDIIGQCLIILFLSFIISLIVDNKKQENSLLNCFVLLTLCITLKTYFVVYFLFFLYLFWKVGVVKIFKIILQNYLLSIFLLLIMISFFVINIFNTGCIIYPFPSLCFESLFWSMPIEEVKSYQIWYEVWAKSLAGAGYRVEDYLELLNILDWLPIWIKNYFFTKGLENILLIIFLSTIFLMTFRYKQITNKYKKTEVVYVFSIIFIIFCIWFFKHPSLRYGGYAPLFLLFAIPVSFYVSLGSNYKVNINKSFKILFIISITFFSLKNIFRIQSEFQRNDLYKFNNFPFFYVSETKYELIIVSDVAKVYKLKDGDNCWATPSPCPYTKNIKAKKKFGFIIFYKDKKK